ncbi:SDR family NAD(P)-dependent oxidoreductase [Actinocorallia longicatena]|uniref:NADP-dependent 3-hydroxy acid dehydrogenase YdfG n=1 Tax=Actinocorallia longicatena TaxID=111803 RepID=A0ABP6QM91_9ACTN
MKDFRGGTAVITGAASGFGRATSLALAERGMRILAADLDLPGAERTVELAARLGPGGAAYAVDVADVAAMEKFADAVKAEHGVPDLVMNNAGIAITGPFLDTSFEDWEKIIGVNLTGVVNGSRIFGRQMAERNRGLPRRERSGHIVNIASAASYTPVRSLPSYCTTKAAVRMLSECMRADLASEGIGVTCVCPGFSGTNIARNSLVAAGVPEEVAERLHRRGERALRLRGYPPSKVAARIVKAVERNEAVVSVNFEGHLAHYAARFAPSVNRLIARIPAGF